MVNAVLNHGLATSHFPGIAIKPHDEEATEAAEAALLARLSPKQRKARQEAQKLAAERARIATLTHDALIAARKRRRQPLDLSAFPAAVARAATERINDAAVLRDAKAAKQQALADLVVELESAEALAVPEILERQDRLKREIKVLDEHGAARLAARKLSHITNLRQEAAAAVADWADEKQTVPFWDAVAAWREAAIALAAAGRLVEREYAPYAELYRINLHAVPGLPDPFTMRGALQKVGRYAGDCAGITDTIHKERPGAAAKE